MVFSSYVFIFLFLPAACLGFFACSKISTAAAKLWLCAASIVFYGYWFVGWIPVLILSILFNYVMGGAIRGAPDAARRTLFLGAAVAVNLAALFYYKYLYAVVTFFGIAQIAGHPIDPIALPLGISFFTFTQIAYLVDTSQGSAKEYSLINYVLFVTFFPHLIAGPIVHHRDLMPQFEEPRNYRLQPDEMAVGLTIFVFGLCKKTVIADRLGYIADQCLAANTSFGPSAAWIGTLAYSMQLYFDFSGYSDMAIGLARMFGIKFPLNFNAPYKAASIIDFWQRWHITLTRFLTAYVYNPVALYIARRRAARGRLTTRKAAQTLSGFLEMIAIPTVFTMILAGIWHGAGLQFMIFGLLHGVYLTVNHAWRTFGPKPAADAALHPARRIAVLVASVGLTYLGVLVAQVFFRAPSVGEALHILSHMAGLGEARPGLHAVALNAKWALYVAAAMLVAWTMPNTQQIMARVEPALCMPRKLPAAPVQWRMDLRWAILAGCAFLFGALNISHAQPFLYFQF